MVCEKEIQKGVVVEVQFIVRHVGDSAKQKYVQDEQRDREYWHTQRMDAAQSANDAIQKWKCQIEQKSGPDIPSSGKDRVDVVRKQPVQEKDIREDARQFAVHDKARREAEHIDQQYI